MGHAINKVSVQASQTIITYYKLLQILKDTILRCQILQGNKVHYIPGWDCHGLPIEMKALANSDNKSPAEIRYQG